MIKCVYKKDLDKSWGLHFVNYNIPFGENHIKIKKKTV